MLWKLRFLCILGLVILIHLSNLLCDSYSGLQPRLPLVINTWTFKEANAMAWATLHQPKGNKLLDALVEGLSTCERLQCDGTVGYGGSPDESSETTLDAMLMDGSTMNVGAVAGLRQIKDAARVARYVLEHTKHTLLVGDAATNFAEMMGFKRENLSTQASIKKFNDWSAKNCQPNFWVNVKPDPQMQCGPYKAIPYKNSKTQKTVDLNYDRYRYSFGQSNHDTIGMIVIGEKGDMMAGTSTNGAIHKIPGRVGDSPIPGSGAYADNEVGAAVATGDGDILMRFSPSLLAVEYMRMGMTPEEAAEKAIQRILRHYPELSGAIVTADRHGKYSSACAGMPKFPYVVTNGDATQTSRVEYKDCVRSSTPNLATLNGEVNELGPKIRNLQNVMATEIPNPIKDEKNAMSPSRMEDKPINDVLGIEITKDETKTDSKDTIIQMHTRVKHELEELYNGILEAEQALTSLNNKLTKHQLKPYEATRETKSDGEKVVQSNPNSRPSNVSTFGPSAETIPKSKLKYFPNTKRITFGNLIPKKYCMKAKGRGVINKKL